MPVVPPGDTVDRRPQVLPAELVPLFDDVFVQSWGLFEEYVSGLAVRVAGELGLLDGSHESAEAAAGWAVRIGLAPDRAAPFVDWLLRQLAVSGSAEAVGPRVDGVFRIVDAKPSRDPAEVVDDQRALDAAALPSFELASLAAAAWPAVVRGETEGERVLFGPDRMAAWGEYFSNHNLLYAVNNRVAAEACLTWTASRPLRVLELGGGFGSAAMALFEAFADSGRLSDIQSYRFTDVAVPFLRRGQRALESTWASRVPLKYGRVDVDRPLTEQGIESSSVDLVWAVNTLHVARDLRATLREIRQVLVPGGLVVLGECIQPRPGQPLAPEFIFQLLESFRAPRLDPDWRPNGGFLTPRRWTSALEAAGMTDVRLRPDLELVWRHYPSFVVAAVGARRPE
jgi:SAM-dependent methyltransferase